MKKPQFAKLVLVSSIALALTWITPNAEPYAIASDSGKPSALRSSTSTALRPKVTNAFSTMAETIR